MYENKTGVIEAISQAKGIVKIEEKWLIAKKDAVRQALLPLSKGSRVEYNTQQEQGKKETELTFIRYAQAQDISEPPQKGTILRHLVAVHGLNSDDVKLFGDLRVKSNKEQIAAMIKELNTEYMRRA